MPDLAVGRSSGLSRAARIALAQLARATTQPLVGASVEEIATAYAATGWRADAAVLDALAAVRRPNDVAMVKAAILPLYKPWLEAGALALQQVVGERRWLPSQPAALPP